MQRGSQRVKLAVALAAASLAVGLVSTSALASVSQHRFPYQPNPANACTNEFVVYEGTAHLVVDVTGNRDGSFTVFEHFNTQGVTGIGSATGDGYVVSEVTNDRTSYDLTAQPVETQTVHHLVVVHEGEGVPFDDRYEHLLVKTTWSDGVPTVVFDNSRIECR